MNSVVTLLVSIILVLGAFYLIKKRKAKKNTPKNR